MIEIRGLSKSFPTADGDFSALRDVNLTIADGDIYGIVGMSGAGKSTLVRCINLLERPTSGTVVIDGEDMTALSPSALREKRRDIGMIFQQFNLMSNRTVYDNVAFNLTVAGYPRADIYKRVMDCLEIVDLTDRAGHYPAQLSGGQKQRVGIARAIAPSPKVLLADEPTSALDPSTTRSLLTCLRDINEQLGVTIVIVTHEMSVIRRLCDRAALLHQGQLLEVADIRDGLIQATTPIGKGLVHED